MPNLTQESRGERTHHPKVGHLQIKAVLYIWSKDASLSHAWTKFWSQSHPIPQQDGFSLSFKGQKGGVSYDRMRFVSLGLAGTGQGLVAKFTVFQIPRVASS